MASMAPLLRLRTRTPYRPGQVWWGGPLDGDGLGKVAVMLQSRCLTSQWHTCHIDPVDPGVWGPGLTPRTAGPGPALPGKLGKT